MEVNCFSLKDFNQSGGATIRISGILNALNSKGVEVNFYSTKDTIEELSSEIKIQPLSQEISSINKRKFQFLLAISPFWFVNLIFHNELKALKKVFNPKPNNPVLFFEYLDISIGYWLKKNQIIHQFYADVHGIAPLEFELNEEKSVVRKASNWIKKFVSKRLDKKVFTTADLVIYSSEGVKNELIKMYSLQNVKSVVVEESINESILTQTINLELLTSLKEKLKIDEATTVFLFAGAFKQLGGVADLVKAYSLLKKNDASLNTRLILVGDGELESYCKELVNNNDLSNEVFFMGRQSYSKLKTFHSIADIIVCPDKDTIFSQLLPHIKYFDSLTSGKIVINGKFEFTETLNPNQKFSLNFKPSNVNSLAETMRYALNNKEELSQKYAESSEEAIQTFSYSESTGPLLQHL